MVLLCEPNNHPGVKLQLVTQVSYGQDYSLCLKPCIKIQIKGIR